MEHGADGADHRGHFLDREQRAPFRLISPHDRNEVAVRGDSNDQYSSGPLTFLVVSFGHDERPSPPSRDARTARGSPGVRRPW